MAELPLTAGHRIRKRTLRQEGLAFAKPELQTLWLDPDNDCYSPLSADNMNELIDHLTAIESNYEDR